jgi:signal transduction histidine kinase
MRLRPRTLRACLTLTFTCGAAIAVGSTLLLLFLLLNRQLATTLDAGLTARGAQLTAELPEGGVAVVAWDPLAQLYAPDGTLLAGSPALGGHRLLTVDDVRGLGVERRETRTLQGVGDGGHMKTRMFSRRLGDRRVLTVGISAEPLEGARRGLLHVVLFIAPLPLAALAGVGWFTVRAALRPVDELTRAAETIALRTHQSLPSVPGVDEIARLRATLEGMLGRWRAEFDQERAFVDDASHELRTPLAVLRGEIEFALLSLDEPEERERSLWAALREAHQLSRLADDLLLLARKGAGALILREKPVDLLALAEAEAARLQRPLGLRIRVSGVPVVVTGDGDRFRQVLANLAHNSATAGATTVQMHSTTDRAAAILQIADDGPGFPHELLGSAFEPFARGVRAHNGDGSGAGLGLSIVRAVMSAHGGTVEARNGAPLGGAVLTLRLPPR